MSSGRTADTSVVVPALTEWHEHHALGRAATDGIERLPAHVVIEAYSVLTRLPRGLAIPPPAAVELLIAAFPGPSLTLTPEEHLDLVQRLGAVGVRGGQAYDAVVAATAARGDAELITLDHRALPIYRALGVPFRLAGS